MTNDHILRRRGINYDVGTFTRGRASSSRDHFDPDIVRREMEIIKRDLHCNAVRISGEPLPRLVAAAEYALAQGLEVWFSPAKIDANEQETLDYFAECAKAAESLRKQSDHLVFVTGCELTFFMKGLVDGATSFDRIATFMKPWKLLKSTIVRGSFQKRLNRFLSKAAAVVREHFHGSVTYASGTWENVDWTPFDYVGIDYYRDAHNKANYAVKLRDYFKHGKPVIVLEFGCCTYQGAEDKGGYGWNIVDRSAVPPQLKGNFVRDEAMQARQISELLDIFEAEKINGAFLFTFVSVTYPYNEQTSYDLDKASYSVVKTYTDQTGTAYNGMPWEPKASFHAVADYYAKLRSR
ncbi:abortive infection protein [Paenibacillus thalictri]|uniref:Abortive infection protein n=1 Tax=Paenibacillus thalictri TaxID=2527873 RepID=A0A4Q9DNR9_9BACL|nr:abortive infection protein [Paenibacillus thalictri]TBL75692.1 abortive infection protein [Paenibacillus thalictri]